MASPLSHKANTALNVATPSIRVRTEEFYSCRSSHGDDDADNMLSSPFLANVADPNEPENIATIKSSPSSIAREATSPLKMLSSRSTTASRLQSPIKFSETERIPRKLSSPEKRFPVKANLSTEVKSPTKEHIPTATNLLVRDEGLARAIEFLNDDDSGLGCHQGNDDQDTTILLDGYEGEADCFADETAFSTFSAVPDMTMFAKIGHSPPKLAHRAQSPKKNRSNTPATARKPMMHERSESPTLRRGRGDQSGGNTTNLILDFTEQFNSLSRLSPNGRERQFPTSQTVSDLFSFPHNARTPSPAKTRQEMFSPCSRMSNLLDFDIPPAPTPRSMPTITPRELESLKSGFLSEISSLKASLSGKEAEVQSLKTAVGDAEKRVGQCMEQVREERNLKEQLAVEKEGWEKRGREMEVVLRNVKEEIVHGERERDTLEGQLDESEKRREAAEMMAQEAESKMAGMRAGSASMSDSNSHDKKSQAESGGREVEVAVEKVARELHILYKSKHETKVAALKKSYENRWDKKIKELQVKLEELTKDNEELRVARDATMSAVVPKISSSDMTEELTLQAVERAKVVKELEARFEGLSEEVKSVKRDNLELRRELDQERIEKGELVAACDELLALQEAAPANSAVISGVENLRGSISRASGLRAPNFGNGFGIPMHAGESRIGKVERGRSGSAQGSRPGSGLGFRGGIMSSIEKMGSYKGRVD